MKSYVAMAFGSFDPLHLGHIHYLRDAARYGRLVVVVARDESIEKLKGRIPVMDEKSRLGIIESLRFVDKAVLGGRIGKPEDQYAVLLKFRPKVVVLGYDQKVDMAYLRSFIKKHGMGSRIVRTRPYMEDKFKSSKIRRAAGYENSK